MNYSHFLPVLVLLSLIWLLISASFARRPKKGTLEWVHRAVSPSMFSTDSLRGLNATALLPALAAGLAAFFLTLLYNLPVYGSAAYMLNPVSTILVSEIGIGVSAACSFLFFFRLSDGVAVSFIAAGLTAFVTPLLLPGECSAIMSLALLFLLFSTRFPAWLLVYGALCGATAFLIPSSVLFFLFGLILSVLISFIKKTGRCFVFFLLSLVAAAGVYCLISYLTLGYVSAPAFSITITIVKSAATVCLFPLVLYSFVRLLREKSFGSTMLFSFLILGIFLEFTGITVVWIFAAAAAADAFSTAITRGSAIQKASGWVFIALCIISAALFFADRFGLFPGAFSFISSFSATIITI